MVRLPAAVDPADPLPELEHHLALLRGQEISVDLFLGCEIGEVPLALRRRCEASVAALLARDWSPERRAELFGCTLIPPHLVRDAARVAYINMAALAGAVGPESMASRHLHATYADVERRLQRFVAARGWRPLVHAFWAHRMYEHARAIDWYRPMPEEDFASGRLHLPAYPEFCSEDLLWGVATGRLQLVSVHGRVCICFTAAGERRWQVLKAAWEGAHALEERERLRQRWTWLTHGALYETMIDRVVPDHHSLRRTLYDLVQLWPGAVVLDVGSGYGPGLLEPGGVVDRVGARGSVIALDPQEHPLRVLAATARRRGRRQVRTVVGIGERMPLPSGSVDVVLSQGALQFIDIEAFFAEAARVLRPNGLIAMFFPLEGYGRHSPYFQQARAIVSSLRDGHGLASTMRLCDPADVRRHLVSAGFHVVSERAVHGRHVFARPQDLPLFMLQTIRFMQRDLADLPWREQQDRVQQLEAELTALGERLPPEARLVDWSVALMVAAKGVSPFVGAVDEPPEPDGVPVGSRVLVRARADVILLDGKRLRVPPAAARVLRALAQSSGPLTTDALLARTEGMSRQTMYNALAALRQALPAPLTILLKRGHGYVIVDSTCSGE